MTTVTDTSSTKSPAEIFSAIAGKRATNNSLAAGSVEDQENKFLTLLMTQIQNQDPLNPLDNAQVTSQLAQLNTVSGIEKLNSTLTELLSGYNEAQAMQAAGMIGKNVTVAGNALPLSGGKALGGATLEAPADQVIVNIKDASGRLVQTQDLGAREAGTFYFNWDGKNAAGAAENDGTYSFTIQALSAGKPVTAEPVQIGTVSAVVRGKTGFLLDLGSLGDVAFKDVQQIL